MPQERLGNDEFLTSLGTLLSSTSTSGHGSVFLTQKPMPASDESTPSSQVLIRATNGASSSKPKTRPNAKVSKTQKHTPKQKIKLATVVETSDLESFYTKYADVCKKGMEGLRKRDKKKAKEKAKAAKKKGKGNAA
ncbi:hypothetical protein PMZ80_004857 [Knufia obscura]|uniref:Signal recognition particle subunit SRP14 n=2 Tax=Knufia TaxID=430999 RepID=A0AAN8IIB1_9EURO|nr:hypothetical protein PMZ80_004857 [Knufia obscura]KAK5948937.1 hypothetical protein OHC33_010023 [Knufia fluminis]